MVLFRRFLVQKWPSRPIDWLIMMGWDYVSELRPPMGILLIPQVICEHGEPWWWWCQLGDNSWLIHQSSLAVLSAETSGASRRNGRSENFAYQYLKYLKGYLTCCKLLRHGTSGFTSHPKEGALWILSPLKVYRLGWVRTRVNWLLWWGDTAISALWPWACCTIPGQ
jgi:hypothetical protein